MNEDTPPRVFISYSHDSPEHAKQVLDLSERLRADGIETILDQYVNGSPPEGWPRWMLDQLDSADSVLVVCTDTYYRRFRGHEVAGKGKGADWEGALITQELYDARSKSLKFVPVFLSAAVVDWIPEPLRSRNHYALTSEDAYGGLYDFLLAQSGVEPGEIGNPKRKARRRGTPLTFGESPRSPEVSGKTRIVLFVGASPLGMARLNIAEEIRQIAGALSSGPSAGQFKLVAESEVRRLDFVPLVESHRPDILHFTGYESDTGGIRLMDEDGQPTSIERQALVRFFEIQEHRPQLLFLNTCHSWGLARELSGILEHVIAYKADTTDDIAIRFAKEFYRALATGLQVPAALARAKIQLTIDGADEDHLPDLLSAATGDPPAAKPGTAHRGSPTVARPPVPDEARRRRTEWLSDLLARFEAKPGVLSARNMMDDYKIRTVELFPSGLARPGQVVEVTAGVVRTALAEEDADDDPQEATYNAIRDCFDAYFDALEQFDLDLRNGFVDEQEVESKLGYWIQQFSDETVSKKGPEFVRAARQYVQRHYPGEIQSLCSRFGRGFPSGADQRSNDSPAPAEESLDNRARPSEFTPAPRPGSAPSIGTRGTGDAPSRDLVYISYSHKDRQWQERLRELLMTDPALRNRVWDDTNIPSGADIANEIDQHVDRARVMIMIGSADYFGPHSGAAQCETRPALRAHSEGELHILWFPVGAFDFEHSPVGRIMAATGPGAVPLNTLPLTAQKKALRKVLSEVRRCIGLAEPVTAPKPRPTQPAGHNRGAKSPGHGSAGSTSRQRRSSSEGIPRPESTSAMQPPVDFVILTPLEEERDAMLAHLGNPKRLPPSTDDIRIYYPADVPVTFTDGSNSTYRVVVTDLLGMGRVEAANAMGDAIRRWRPRYVLLVGIAGGFAKAGVQLGDVLVSEQIADYELQKLTEEKTLTRWSVHRASPALLAAAKQMRPEDWHPLVRAPRPQPGKPQRHAGPICTGDKVVANGLLDQHREVWTKLIGVEMEAGGGASAAFQAPNAPGFFMVRGVSDMADPEKDTDQTQSWRAYACDVAAAYVEAFLRSGPVVPVARERSDSNPR